MLDVMRDTEVLTLQHNFPNYTLYDTTDMKFLEKAKLQRQKADQCVVALGKGWQQKMTAKRHKRST